MAINNSKEHTRGDTGMYSITLYDLAGDEYTPSAGETLTFYLMNKDCDDLEEAILVKDIPISTMQLELEPADTKNLPLGTYSYRIRITDTLGHEWTVIKSKLKLIC